MALTQHIFISYADKDGKHYRDRLIKKLKRADFSDRDYWYDKRDIEPGEEWRDEIDKALSESFIVIVILTPGAAESHTVTYEWARALGDGLSVIPLIFAPLPKDLNHPLVDRKHWVDCIKKKIPDKVIEKVKEYSETPPDLRYLNKLIMQEVMLFRVLSRISLWLYPYSYSGIVGEDFPNQLIAETLDEASRLFSSKLVDILVTKSHAFTSKQRRMCRQLSKGLERFWEIIYKPSAIRPYYGKNLTAEAIERANSYRLAEIEPVFLLFDTETPSDVAYRKLDFYLTKISENTMPPDGMPMYPPTGEMLWSIHYDVIRWTLDNKGKADAIIEAIETVRRSQVK